MIISIIVAVDRKGGIGFDGKIPWHLSSDLKRFKELTMGHFLIMGRKTYESIGKPLPGRRMIVVTRNPSFSGNDCLLAYSLAEALILAKEGGEEEVFVIGGGEIFKQALSIADRIYLTKVETSAKTDTYFPVYDEDEWEVCETSNHPADEQNEYESTYSLLVRKNAYSS